MEYYQFKSREYFSNARTEFLSVMPACNDLKVLEIGAGGGDTLVALKEMGKASEVVGIELFHLENSNQGHPSIDRMIIGDISDLVFDYPENYFDVVLCGDVIEHLTDPWTVLTKISKFIKKDGVFISSIPNIRHFSALKSVFFKGEFKYQPSGLFDKTHYRFFCKKDMVELFYSSGYRVSSIFPRIKLYKGSKINFFNRVTFGLFEEFLTLQYIVIATKKS